MMEKKKLAGICCGILTGVCWGLSGVFSQYLFTGTDMQSDWFVSVRMLTSGLCIALIFGFTKRDELKELWKNKRDLLRCILTGIFGTMLFQFACYGAVQRSNAATAIVLQYLCPVMVMIYVCIRKLRWPKKQEVLSLILALSGIFLIATHGNLQELVISKDALVWGIGCAFFMMLSTVIPEPLYAKYSSQTVTSIAMLFGGITSAILVNPVKNCVKLSGKAWVVLLLAIVFGGMIAYVLYGMAVKWIGPSKASLFACSEILTATILSVLFLGNRFSYMDFIGFVFIASTIFILSYHKRI